MYQPRGHLPSAAKHVSYLSMPSAPQRILIYRLGSLGDTVIALPALHLAARAFPDADRRLLTNVPVHQKAPAAAEVLAHTNLVHGYLRYPVATRNPFTLLALWWSIRRFRPDALIYLASARGIADAQRDARFFRLCGIRRILGLPLTPDAQRRTLPDGSIEPEAHRLARNLAADLDPTNPQAANLDDPNNWNLRLTPEEQAHAAALHQQLGNRPLIALSVGTKRQSKDWGRDNWRALVAHLATAYPGHALVLTGSPDEHDLSEFVAQDFRAAHPSAVLNLCSNLPPRLSAALYARARIFLGHDSGPMHLAAAVQTPCVIVFSARTRPRVWFPIGAQHRILYREVDCMGCGLETCIVQKRKCLTSISVAETLAAIASVLGAIPSQQHS